MARSVEQQVQVAQQQVDTSIETLRTMEGQVSAAQEQVTLSRAALDSSIQPILVDVPMGVFCRGEDIEFDPTYAVLRHDTPLRVHIEDRGEIIVRQHDGFVFCSVPFRNIGTGAAFVTGLGLRAGDVSWSGKISRAVLPPNDITRVSFAVPEDRPELKELLQAVISGHFNIEVLYTNVNGTGALLTRASTRPYPGGECRVRQIFLTRRGEQEPFAASGPSDAI